MQSACFVKNQYKHFEKQTMTWTQTNLMMINRAISAANIISIYFCVTESEPVSVELQWNAHEVGYSLFLNNM